MPILLLVLVASCTTKLFPDNTVAQYPKSVPAGAVRYPDGSIHYPDGMIASADEKRKVPATVAVRKDDSPGAYAPIPSNTRVVKSAHTTKAPPVYANRNAKKKTDPAKVTPAVVHSPDAEADDEHTDQGGIIMVKPLSPVKTSMAKPADTSAKEDETGRHARKRTDHKTDDQ